MNVLQAILLVGVLVLIYFLMKPLFASDKQNYAEEVFLVKTAVPFKTTTEGEAQARKYGGRLATPAQVQHYVVSGGSCPWRGLVSDGTIVYAPGAQFDVPALTLGSPDSLSTKAFGLWIYAPKPKREPGSAVSAFSCKYWFQPLGLS